MGPFSRLLTCAQDHPNQQIILFSTVSEDQTNYRMMDVAAYLLFQNFVPGRPDVTSLITYGTTSRTGVVPTERRFGLYPEVMLALGAPTDSVNVAMLPGVELDPVDDDGDHWILTTAAVPRLLVRHFEQGMVIVDWADAGTPDWTVPIASLGGIIPDTVHRVIIDDHRLVDGGTITSEPMSSGGTLTTTAASGTILMYAPVGSPTASERCVYALLKGAVTPQLVGVRIQTVPSGQGVWVDATDRSGTLFDGPLRLYDDHTHGDEGSCDGLYTGELSSLKESATPGDHWLHVFMQDAKGIAAYDSVVVHVVIPQAKYINKTADVGLTPANSLGLPYSVVSLDYDNDGDVDLLVTKDGAACAILRNMAASDSPLPYFDVSWLPLGGTPYYELRGACAADCDNDGLLDVFTGAGSGGHLFHGVRSAESGEVSFVDAWEGTDLAATTSNSWCGAWSDYDRDGYVDLFVGRKGIGASGSWVALPDRLLHNDQGMGFTHMTEALPEELTDPTFTLAASWGDVNGDGLPDLFVGSEMFGSGLGDAQGPPPLPTAPSWSKLYVNQGDGHFVNSYWQYFGYRYPWGLNSVQWSDLDNDGDWDLVYAGEHEWSGYVLNDNGHFSVPPVLDPSEKSGALAYDYDLDGAQDVLLLTRYDGIPPALGRPAQMFRSALLDIDSPGLAFDNIAGAAGMGMGAAGGATATCFNASGAPDLFVGRRLLQLPEGGTTECFYQNVSVAGTDVPANHWVGIRLKGGGVGNNVSAIGATVTISAGALQQVRRVDGGSGRGGQESSIMLFGLGGYSETVRADVTWPNGLTQVVESIPGGAVREIVDATASPGLQSATVKGDAYTSSTGTHWVFIWDTLNATCADKDEVTLTGLYAEGSECYGLGGPVVLKFGVNGVIVSQAAKSGGGQEHRLEWDAPGCWPACSCTYTVKCGTYLDSESSGSTGIVSATAAPGIVATSVTGTYYASMEDTYWAFSWDSASSTCSESDEVEVTSSYDSGSPCYIGGNSFIIKRGVSGVVASVQPKSGGGYTHRIEWHNMGCSPNCTYNYVVRSSTLASMETSPASGTKRLRITLCVQ